MEKYHHHTHVGMINILVLERSMEKKNIARNVKTIGNVSMSIIMRGIRSWIF